MSLRVAQQPEDRRQIRRDRALDFQPFARHLPMVSPCTS
jgi:hypothetical protein